MLCSSCTKLATIKANRACMRCQGTVLTNIGILCDSCSTTQKKCAICIKTIVQPDQRHSNKGCNCGGK